MDTSRLTQDLASPPNINHDQEHASTLPTSELASACDELGVELMGITQLVDDEGRLVDWFMPHAHRLEEWLRRGDHAEMSWMHERREARQDPRVLLPEVRSGITLWISHHFPEELSADEARQARGYEARVARYAWGRDYHNVLRRILRRLSKWIQARDPRATSHGSVDTSPVLERAIAERCGVGWIGKSTMLIHPQRGTFGSLAVLLTSARFDRLDQPPTPRCGTCTACIDRCPTQALSASGLDARRCISYWTIEHRGVIPREIRPLLGEWTFGCDLCQDVCPWSVKAERRASPPDHDVWRPRAERARPDLLEWLRLSDDELNESLLGSPLRRAHPYGLKRNAIITLTNQRYAEALPIIWEQLHNANPAVRATAIWGIMTLTSYLDQEAGTPARLTQAWRRISSTLSAEDEGEVIAEMMWARALIS